MYIYVLYTTLYTAYCILLCYIVLSQGQAFYVVQSVNGQSSQATVYSGKRGERSQNYDHWCIVYTQCYYYRLNKACV